MSGTVLSRTDRHTQHSSGAARSATALRRTASVPPSPTAPAVARPSGGDPSSDTDAAEADPATSSLLAPALPAPPDVTTRDQAPPGDAASTTVAPDPNRIGPSPAGPDPADLGQVDLDLPGPPWVDSDVTDSGVIDPGVADPATPTASAGTELNGTELNGTELNGTELNGTELDRPAVSSAEPTAALTVTLAIPLTGEPLTPQTRRLLDALRELVELGQGAVTTSAVPSPAAAPDSAPLAVPGQPGRRGDTFAGSTSGLLGAAPVGGATLRNGASVDAGRPDTDRVPVDGADASGHVPGPRVQTSANPAEVRLLTASRQVLLGGQPLAMTRLEFDLLLFLAGNPRRVFTRAQLLGAVWGYEHTGERTVDVHVRRLRVKMGVQVPLITTVYGVGYRLDDDARIVVVAHE